MYRVADMYSLGTCPAKKSSCRVAHGASGHGGAASAPTSQLGDASASGTTASYGRRVRSCVICSSSPRGGSRLPHGAPHSLFVSVSTTGTEAATAAAIVGCAHTRCQSASLDVGEHGTRRSGVSGCALPLSGGRLCTAGGRLAGSAPSRQARALRRLASLGERR